MSNSLFTESQKKEIVSAIQNAEKLCSGEIRVHIDDDCEVNPLDRAVEVFKLLEMNKTKLRNGVLFYLSVEDHKFAVIGDVGINSVVSDHFWHDIRDVVLSNFKEGEYVKGLISGINMVGEVLAKNFPYNPLTDVNELRDDISYN